ncbi:Lipase [Camponotus japonicus]
MYLYTLGHLHIVHFSLLFIQPFIDGVKLIGIVYLALFYGYLDCTLVDVNQLEPSAFMEKISWINWIWPNNIKVNRDVVFDTSEMIRKAGYPVETHVTTTEDGYLLTLHRIPGDNGSLPVLLQHGFFCTSAVWVILGKGKGLAYVLADHGYDVWLGNFRGNTYSRAHITLSPSNSTFWDFSLNELGIYDLPAMITYITNMRSQPLHTFIGHSMGATCSYIMATERPEIARMVKAMISLAPTVFVNYITSPLQYLVFLKDYKMIMRFFFHEILLSNFVRSFLTFGCDQKIIKDICSDVMFIMWGYDREQFDYLLLPLIVGHFPAGNSFNTLVHYAQIFQSGKFRHYDYGRAKNILIYNSMEPPEYNLANITIPTALFYGPGDLLDNIMDAERLYRELPNVVDIYEVPWRKFNHADFLWAKDAPKLVYERVLKIMRRENSNNVTSIIKIKDVMNVTC